MSVRAAPVTVWFVRHGEIASHRGDVPLTEAGVREAELAGERLAGALEPGARVELLHAPTQRTLQTLEALRRGIERALDPAAGVELGEPRVEPAIRNPDLFVGGTRVEMVSSAGALAEQLSEGLPSREDAAAGNAFFARFWSREDRIGVWMEDDDPPGERAEDVARRCFTFARSLLDVADTRPRHYVCVTHSGPLRALVRAYVQHEDPGEPAYVESVQLCFEAGGRQRWRFRDVVAAAAGGWSDAASSTR